jgi:hypothetical protein
VEHQRSERTIEGYRHHVVNYFRDWHDIPLIELANAPDRVDKRHRDLTLNHGSYAANGGMRTLSAIYNNTARTIRELRRLNPVEAVRFQQVRNKPFHAALCLLFHHLLTRFARLQGSAL